MSRIGEYFRLGKLLQEALEANERLSCEGKLKDAVIEAASRSVNIDRRDDLVKWFQRLANALALVSEEPARDEALDYLDYRSNTDKEA